MNFSQYLKTLEENNSEIEDSKNPSMTWEAPTLKEDWRQSDPNAPWNRDDDDDEEDESPIRNQHGETSEEHRAGQKLNRKDTFDNLNYKMGDSRRRGGPRATQTAARGSFRKLRKVVENTEVKNLEERSVGHMRRQLGSTKIPYSRKREIQQRLHDKETRNRKRQLRVANDPNTPLDVAINAADKGTSPVTPAPKPVRKLSPAQKKEVDKNAPEWVKQRTAEVERDNALGREADDMEHSVGMTDRQRHRDR